MRAQSAGVVIAEVGSGKAVPGYLVYGEEAYWHERLIDALARKFPSGGETVSGDETSWQSLRDLLSQPSFFGPQLWIVREAQSLFKEGEDRFVDAVSPGTCLVLSCPVKENPASKAFLGKWETLGGSLVEAAEPSFAEASSWVSEALRSRGLRIASDAVETLITIVGRSIERLEKEVEKIEAYMGPVRDKSRPQEVGTQVILQCASADPEKTSFAFIDAVGARNASRAFSEYLDLKARGANPVAIVALLASHFGLVWRAKEAEMKKTPQNELGKALGVHPYAAKKAAAEARRWTFAQMETALRTLCAVDEDLKRGRIDPDRAMDYLLSQICT
ncbi:MAG: DNA polymerase III subunit delta [Bacillota bacterium]